MGRSASESGKKVKRSVSKSPNNYYALNNSAKNSNSLIGGSSDFNNGTGAEKKRVAPGNVSQ